MELGWLIFIMLTKKQALITSIKNALLDFNSYSFKIRATDIAITGVSNVDIQDNIEYYPSIIDDSNLEKLEGGRFNASFRIKFKEEDILREMPCSVYGCIFKVDNYDANVFSIKIKNVNAE